MILAARQADGRGGDHCVGSVESQSHQRCCQFEPGAHSNRVESAADLGDSQEIAGLRLYDRQEHWQAIGKAIESFSRMECLNFFREAGCAT
jgi:hypothetical protein